MNLLNSFYKTIANLAKCENSGYSRLKMHPFPLLANQEIDGEFNSNNTFTTFHDFKKFYEGFISRKIIAGMINPNEIDNLLNSEHTTQLEINYKDHCLNSWGSGVNHQEAFEKASYELIERLFFVHQSKFRNTNGVALHTKLESAKKNASAELIERHTLLHAQDTSMRPYYLFSSKGISFYAWKSVNNHWVVFCHFKTVNGFIFSHAASTDLLLAIIRSKHEISGKIVAYLYNSLNNPKNQKNCAKLDHSIFAIQVYFENANRPCQLIENAIPFAYFNKKAHSLAFSKHEIKLNFTLIDCPKDFSDLAKLCFVIKAHHPDLREPDFVHPSITQNLEKIYVVA